jgi:predicted nuclease with TOPRIM domain
MAQDFEQLLKDVFGEPLSKLTQFQSDQLGKLTARLQEIARESVKEDLKRLQQDVADLRTRLGQLEEERAQAAADSVESSF